jgi:hypothetical protein
MKTALLLTVVALASVQVAPKVETGIVQGTVVHTETGEPISGVQIALTRTGPISNAAAEVFASLPAGVQLTAAVLYEVSLPPPSLEGRMMIGFELVSPQGSYTTVTDNSGRFRLTGVSSGEYSIAATRDGYLAPSSALGFYGSEKAITAPFRVTPGESTPQISLSMAPAGTISGLVRKVNGEPIVKASISAFRISYNREGRAQLTPVVSKQTDDRGVFRLFGLAPGDYIVGATPPATLSAPSDNEDYAPTWFPKTVDPSIAQKLSVKAAEDVLAVDIELQTVHTVHISGRVDTSYLRPLNPPVNEFKLLPRDPKLFVDSWQSFPNVAKDRSDGRFEIRGVRPGSYDLATTLVDIGSRISFPGIVRVEVGNDGIDNVNLPVVPGVDVAARIVYTGGRPPLDSASVQLAMRALGNYASIVRNIMKEVPEKSTIVHWNGESQDVLLINGPTYSQSDKSGTYRFPGVPAGRYTFDVAGLPTGAAIADIRDQGISIFESGLELGSGSPGEIEVVVDLSGATAEGTVINARQETVPYSRVVLIPQESRRANVALYRSALADSAGHFKLRGIVPGQYKIFAWRDSPTANAWLNADFMTDYEQRGQTILVESIGSANLKVQVIP